MNDLKDAGVIEFDASTVPHDFKKVLHAQAYGMHTPNNTIVILRGDDSTRKRHGGVIQHVRSFEAYVNATKVETWHDDEARHDYASDDYLDHKIDRWGELWSKALGCPVVRGELRGRVKIGRF